MTIYEPGESATRYADLLPGVISPLPAGVPSGAPLRVIVTSKAITVAWKAGDGIDRVDIPITEEQALGVRFSGGTVGDYSVSKQGSCGCGQNKLRSWKPWPGVNMTSYSAPGERIYGVPPTRYSRV